MFKLVPALCLAAFLLLGSSRFLLFTAGILLMGVAHAVITVKGVHLASHGALSESQAWGKFWAVFFIEVRNKLKAAVKHQFFWSSVFINTAAVVPLSKEPKAIVLIFGEKNVIENL